MRAWLLALVLAACGGGSGAADAGADARDAGCSYLCSGYTFCDDHGIAIRQVDGPTSCDRIDAGICPEADAYQCMLGCRADAGPLAPGDDIRLLCEETRTRRVGDPCVDDDGCRPQHADVPREGGPITSVYLRCDTVAGVCVERPPTQIPDWLASCGIAPGPGRESTIVETTACTGGVCAVGGVRPTCVEQGCTARCADDGDCPPGALCSKADARGARVCTPSRWRLVGDGLPCTAR